MKSKLSNKHLQPTSVGPTMDQDVGAMDTQEQFARRISERQVAEVLVAAHAVLSRPVFDETNSLSYLWARENQALVRALLRAAAAEACR